MVYPEAVFVWAFRGYFTFSCPYEWFSRCRMFPGCSTPDFFKAHRHLQCGHFRSQSVGVSSTLKRSRRQSGSSVFMVFAFLGWFSTTPPFYHTRFFKTPETAHLEKIRARPLDEKKLLDANFRLLTNQSLWAYCPTDNINRPCHPERGFESSRSRLSAI